MKRLTTVLFVTFLIVAGCDSREDLSEDDKTVQPFEKPTLRKSNMQENSYQIAEIYTSLRQQVLELDGEKIEEIKDKSVWAVLMETGYSDAAVTLVGVADGTASLYFSNGGGIIGAGEHEEVRRISLGFVEMSEEYLAEMTKVNKFPIPANGMTTFYILTPKGIFTYKANEEDLGEGRVKISDLFHKGHELIGQMRIAEQTKQKEASE